jgi:alpha-tubulin suppressor-like RCC1 family protein
VWAWDSNGVGQFGNGEIDDTNRTSPSIPLLSNFTGAVAVAVGDEHSVGLRNDGTVWTWGTSNAGALGTGLIYQQSLVPVQVSGLSGIVAVSASYDLSVALKSDGTVWTWGRGYNGQLGNGHTTTSAVPVKVANLTGVVAIDAGYDHVVALKSDGTVWDWGNGGGGMLGNGHTNNSDKPVQVKNLTGMVAVAAGNDHTLAVKADGTVWAWGGGE